MSFDLNKKVKWENLSPSLQSKFKWLDEQLLINYKKILENLYNIARNGNNINMNSADLDALELYLIKKLLELKTKIDNIHLPPSNPVNEGTDDAINNGFLGQVAKVNPGSRTIFAHDNFEQIKVVHNQGDFDAMTQIKQISLKEVFYTWYRYAHYDSAASHELDNSNWEPSIQGQNLNDGGFTCYTDRNQGGWTYDEASQQICCNVDGFPTTGFILPNDGPSSWMMRIRIDSDWDDDNFMIIIGFMKDANGIEHTLSVTRACGRPGGGYIDTKFTWGLIYDMGWVTQRFLINWTNIAGFSISTDTPICYMTVIKNYDKVECRTTRFSSKSAEDKNDVPDWTFKFAIPDQKPGDWSQEMYDNIKIMLRQTSRIGFGCRSDTGRFSIDKQKYIFDDDLIYRIDTDEVYYYDFNTGRWVRIGRVQDYIPGRTYLYNPRTNHLYFYNHVDNYCVLQ